MRRKHSKETDKETNVREGTLLTVDELAEILEARVDFVSGNIGATPKRMSSPASNHLKEFDR